MDNQIKQLSYTSFINTYLNTLPETKISYIWKNVPEQILFDASLITDYNQHRLNRKNKVIDKSLIGLGIDIIQVTKDNKIHFIHCEDIDSKDLLGFFVTMNKHSDKRGYV